MARVTPKQNWVGGNIPLAPDLNRMEGNAQQAFDELDAEVSARIADVNAEEAARVADVDAEQSRATSAEGTLQTNINNEASARASGDTAIFNYLTTVGAVGSHAFLFALGPLNPGDTTSTNIVYASLTNNGVFPGGAATGTWKCLGYIPSAYACCMFVRIS